MVKYSSPVDRLPFCEKRSEGILYESDLGSGAAVAAPDRCTIFKQISAQKILVKQSLPIV